MGLLSWLFGGDKKTRSLVKSKGGGTFPSYAVGHIEYQDALKRIFGERTSEGQEKLVEAVLVPDEGNPYNFQAVRVEIQGQTVGYLKHEDAKHFREKMMQTAHSGLKATCSAKIVYWGLGVNNYVVLLDLPVDYQFQASDPAPSRVTDEKETSGAEVLAFDISELDQDEISECQINDRVDLSVDYQFQASDPTSSKVTDEEESTGAEVLAFDISNLERDKISECQINDRVKLWMPPDDAEKVFLYLGDYILGFVPHEYFELVASHLSRKMPYEARITELAASTCRIKCKLFSEEDAASLQKLERQKFEVEIAKGYAPQKGFDFSIEVPKRHRLREGQLIFLDKEPIEPVPESPTEFGLKFVDELNNVVAHKQWEQEKIRRILRALNSGYRLTIKIQSIERPDNFDLRYMDYIRGIARVDFQKAKDLRSEKV
jgi:hypothetical protein